MMLRNGDDRGISEEAAEWAVRLREDTSAGCYAEFVGWLKLDMRHIDAYLSVEAIYQALAQMDPKHDKDKGVGGLPGEALATVLPLRAERAIQDALAGLGTRWPLAAV